MSIGAALQQSVAQLFALHGYAVTLSRPDDTDGSTYDPTTGGMITPTGIPDWTGVGFFTDFSKEEIGNSSVKTDDRKLLLQAKGLAREPKINDLVDSTVTIMSVKRVRSGASVTHFVCQTRG
jgi:hypothetical protein